MLALHNLFQVMPNSVVRVVDSINTSADGSAETGAYVTLFIDPEAIAGKHFVVSCPNLVAEVAGKPVVRVSVVRFTNTAKGTTDYRVVFPTILLANGKRIPIAKTISKIARAWVERIVFIAVNTALKTKIAVPELPTVPADNPATSFGAPAPASVPFGLDETDEDAAAVA